MLFGYFFTFPFTGGVLNKFQPSIIKSLILYYYKIITTLIYSIKVYSYSILTLTSNTELKLTNVHSFAIATLTMVITFYVFNPSIILNSTTLLALTLILKNE